MENPVEYILKTQGPSGLSLKQLSFMLGIDKRRTKFHIYNSSNVMNTNPLLHGSHKYKINVFCYTPDCKKYSTRKKFYSPVSNSD